MPIPERCKSKTTNPKIVLEENISKMVFLNLSRGNVVVVRVDGCAIDNGIRCDYLVTTDNQKEHYVELKGSDIDHAVSQIERSIQHLSVDRQRQEKISFIISTRCPLFTTKIQELKIRFKRQFNSALIIKNRYLEHTL